MALYSMLTKRLFACPILKPLPSSVPHISNSHISSPPSDHTVSPIACKPCSPREYFTSPETSVTALFRRFLHRRPFYQPSTRLPEFLSLPVGDKLKEKLNSVKVNGVRTPVSEGGLSLSDTRKLLRLAMLENLKVRLREIPESSITYSEFVNICIQGCESSNLGLEFAKMLDEAGDVIVLGNVVLLQPAQVAKSMESLIFESIALPKDHRRRELEKMEKEKAIIDQKAEAQVRVELYSGLGLMMVQTFGFMRLTFWELSWDVMEPICFFVTSVHFFIGYGFFLRTSREPTFEGFFTRRFKTKQKQLMKKHSFDVEKYNALRKACHPDSNHISSFSSERGSMCVHYEGAR